MSSSSDALIPGVRVRFAPAPTGHLHIGGFRTALFNWAFARHHRGSFLVRIEDTDLERSKPEYVQSILASLSWANLLPDEPAVIQTTRDAEHRRMIAQLLEHGKAYCCYCTPEKLMQRCARLDGGDQQNLFFYDKQCRTLNTVLDKPFVVRFAIPESPDPITFDDLVRGSIAVDRAHLDDFIIARSDGRPIYNFVVVVDDAFMKITHVIRGEDHISNTPKQILLYQACGYQIPYFAHLPMILGASGNKLSKRDGAVSVLDYQQEGYLSQALENYLVRLGWSHQDQEIFTRQELIDYFSLGQVGKKGAIFDVAKLQWVNSVYIRQQSPAELFSYLQTYIEPSVSSSTDADNEQVYRAIALYKERAKTLKELAGEVHTLLHGPTHYDQHDATNYTGADAPARIQQLTELLTGVDESHWSAAMLMEQLNLLMSSQTIKFVDIARLLRLALMGKAAGPGVTDLLVLVGRDETLARLSRLRTYLLDRSSC